MICHNKFRAIMHDIGCNFYSQIRHLPDTDEAWQRILELQTAYEEKYQNDKFCHDLLKAVILEVQRNQ